MNNIFFISDTHNNHSKTWNGAFKAPNGIDNLRPFSSNEEMMEHMAKKWDAKVQATDKVYVLGDCAFYKPLDLEWFANRPGKKRLIMGNHDSFDVSVYRKFFQKVLSLRQFNKVICSHVPLHPMSIKERWSFNIHGHMHGSILNDPLYISVCVEQTDYNPLEMSEVTDRVKQNQEAYEATGSVIHWMTGKLYKDVFNKNV